MSISLIEILCLQYVRKVVRVYLFVYLRGSVCESVNMNVSVGCMCVGVDVGVSMGAGESIRECIGFCA